MTSEGLQPELSPKEITHVDGEQCRLIPCKECGDADHELCECDMLRCEQCEGQFCHDHAFNDRDGSGSFCHDCGYGWLTSRQTTAITEDVKRLSGLLAECQPWLDMVGLLTPEARERLTALERRVKAAIDV